MESIGATIHEWFLQALLNDLLEAQDCVEVHSRAKYQALGAETQDQLDKAYAALFAARVRIDQMLHEAPKDKEENVTTIASKDVTQQEIEEAKPCVHCHSPVIWDEKVQDYRHTERDASCAMALDSEEPKSEYLVHLNIQLPREKRIDIEQVEREISGALEVGLGSEEYAPGLHGAEVEIALAEEIG